ncbi:MAG: hypothetical protein ABIQ35_05455 [Verrucomicrobiota bacterium]
MLTILAIELFLHEMRARAKDFNKRRPYKFARGGGVFGAGRIALGATNSRVKSIFFGMESIEGELGFLEIAFLHPDFFSGKRLGIEPEALELGFIINLGTDACLFEPVPDHFGLTRFIETGNVDFVHMKTLALLTQNSIGANPRI